MCPFTGRGGIVHPGIDDDDDGGEDDEDRRCDLALSFAVVGAGDAWLRPARQRPAEVEVGTDGPPGYGGFRKRFVRRDDCWLG